MKRKAKLVRAKRANVSRKRPTKPKPEVATEKRIQLRHARLVEARPHQDILFGEEGWYWHAQVVENNIVVRGVLATWFGGPLDKEDNGETASGVSTIEEPEIMGCALPMDGYGVKSLAGSPLPKMPWKMPVVVATLQGQKVEVVSIDLGPSGYTNHAIDLTTHAFLKLGGNLDTGVLSVDYIILGGAFYTK